MVAIGFIANPFFVLDLASLPRHFSNWHKCCDCLSMEYLSGSNKRDRQYFKSCRFRKYNSLRVEWEGGLWICQMYAGSRGLLLIPTSFVITIEREIKKPDCCQKVLFRTLIPISYQSRIGYTANNGR